MAGANAQLTGSGPKSPRRPASSARMLLRERPPHPATGIKGLIRSWLPMGHQQVPARQGVWSCHTLTTTEAGPHALFPVCVTPTGDAGRDKAARLEIRHPGQGVKRPRTRTDRQRGVAMMNRGFNLTRFRERWSEGPERGLRRCVTSTLVPRIAVLGTFSHRIIGEK